jgi:hypothetical protein
VGTAAALFAAAPYPERIASVIVGTAGAAGSIQLGEPLVSWLLDPDKYRRVDPRAIINAAVETIAGGIPDDIHAEYLASSDGDCFVKSMRYVHRYPEELPALADLLPQIAGAGHDHQRPPRPRCAARQRRVSRRAAPTSSLVVFDGGHFSWERHRRSMRRSSSTRSKAQGCKRTERPHELILR